MPAREQAKKSRELLQRKSYQCGACGAHLLHDQAFVHSQYLCPYRQKGLAARG
jgi:hypothetical protein